MPTVKRESSDSVKMRHSTLFVSGLTVFALFVAVAATANFAGCGGKESTAAEVPVTTGAVPTNVEVITVSRQSFTEYSTFTGVTAAGSDLTLSSETGGLVERMDVEVGDRVYRGQSLARVNTLLLGIQLEQAVADSQFQAKEFTRAEAMFATEAVTERERDRAELAMISSEINARRARIQYRRSFITAPFNAVVAEKMANKGQTVMPGQPLVRVVSLGTVRTSINIPEKDVFHFQQGKSIDLVFDAIPGQIFTGKIVFVSPGSNSSRSFFAQISVPNRSGKLRPGLVANVQAVRRQIADALVVPAGSILDTAQGKAVFATEDSVARLRPVVVGAVQGNEAVIVEGTAAGEQIVVAGHRKLVDGSPIRVVSSEGPVTAVAEDTNRSITVQQ